MEEKRIIDISMKVEEGMAIYPGNPEPKIEKYREVPEDSTTESEISIGSHTGTHVDAEAHVEKEGETADQIDIGNFYGRCRVLDFTGAEGDITKQDIESEEVDEDIILIRTENSVKQRKNFREDFTGLKLSAVDYLIEKGVETVGVDYLSLTPYNGTEEDHMAHEKAIKEMTVIEGLDLEEAEQNKYMFSGFPIKIKADGSPLRAVLIEED